MALNDKYFLNPAHLELAKARYFLKDENGQPIEQDIEEVFNRVVNHIYQNDPEHKEEALRLRCEKKIIDGGRILAQAGTKTKNLLNCSCIGFEDDTREAISELKRKHFSLQAGGMGTGINFSTLRPRGSICKSTQSRSSGAVGFITDLSYQSHNVQQGGNRCLPAESLVTMADGTCKKIIDINVGDKILAYDMEYGFVSADVKEFYNNGIQYIYEYFYDNGSVKSTETHRWLCRGFGEKRFIKTGQEIFSNGLELCILNNKKEIEWKKIKNYNLLKEDYTFCMKINHKDHLFVVDNVVSHNSGANMGILEDWHPDLYDFITKKSESSWENIRKFANVIDEDAFAYFQWGIPYQWQMFNVSVFLSDDFMKKVKENSDEPWMLKWKSTPWSLWDFTVETGPNTNKNYEKNITVAAPNEDMAAYKASSEIPFFNNKSLKLIRGPYNLTAKEWFGMICKNAWKAGCPGVIFIDMARRFNNSEYFNKISGTNPCSEQILPINSVCCLTSLILPSFFNNGKFSWDEFRKAIHNGIRGLDNIISITKSGEKDIDQNMLKERRIGLGATGIGELLIMKGLKYSSQEGRDFVAKLLNFMRDESYMASINLAKERGSFSEFDYEGMSKSEFFQTLPDNIKEDIKKYGIRNVTLLTFAPVGTTGTMLGFSQGIEPNFAMCFSRNSRVGTFSDGSPAFISWLKENNINYSDYRYSLTELKEKTKVPEYFEEAHEINWQDHLKMQAVFSKFCDSSTSKTINMPNSATVEDVENAYLMAYDLGIKSTTVYRDGSKQQILEHIKKDSTQRIPKDITRAISPDRPERLPCDIYHTSVKGETWTVLIGLLNDKPYEVFCAPQESFEISTKYKNGTIIKNGGGSYHLDMGDFKIKNISSYLKNDEHRVITRLISTCLRHGVPMTFISEQLAKANGTVIDFSKAILRVLKKYDETELIPEGDHVCPKCGSKNVKLNGGCPECLDCGSSKCG